MRPSPPDRDLKRDVIAPVGLIIVAAGTAGILAATALTEASISPLVWYLARAAGFTLYLLLWLSVATGLGLTTKLFDRLVRRQDIWLLHRFSTELAFVFLALHLISLALDPSVALGALGVLLPFTTDVRQPWTDIGILAGWGMTGLALSFSLRRLLHQRGWRLLHYSAFPLWVLALVHGIGAGTDTHQIWAAFLYLSTTGFVLFLSLFRVMLSVSGHGRFVAPPRTGSASLSNEPPIDAR
jgi:predicted ferric reductase